MKAVAIGLAVAFAAAAVTPALATGKGGGKKGTLVIMQGYSGKPARTPNLQGTSAYVDKKKGPNVSVWGPGNSPHTQIHTKKGFVP